MAAMEDDFQLVDFKSAQRMDDFVSSDHDDDISNSDSENDGIIAVSDLNSLKKDVSKQLNELKLEQKKSFDEFNSLKKMKEELRNKMSTLDSLIVEHSSSIKRLKEETNEYTKVCVFNVCLMWFENIIIIIINNK